MEKQFQHDTSAELALSAMISMIMILLFSALIAGMSLMIIEQAFMGSRTQSIEQSETLNSIPLVLVFEVEQLDTTGNTNDQLYVMFKFPFAGDTIPDTNVKWAMMCDINDTGVTETGSFHTLVYSSGDFDAATDLSGNGNDDAALDEFFPGTYYHVVIEITSPDGDGECDLNPDMHATMVIAVEKGRTTELDFYLPDDVQSGHDLMS
jgi:hypothetical protein